MSNHLRTILRQRGVVALVGANNHPSKYGNIIYKDLIRKGFEVLPINPGTDEVEGARAFPDLTTALAHKRPDLVVYVIPPSRTRKSLEEALALGLKQVWVQPGAGDESVRAYLEDEGFEYVLGGCVMVEA